MKAETLKKSILQYAIEGKLVPQNPNDEPASELLRHIKAEKEQLIKDGKLKKEKPLPPITDEEKPFHLPQGWEWIRFADCLDVRDGTHDSPKYVKQGYPFVTSKNLQNGRLDFSNIKYISKDDFLKFSQRSNVDNGDILFAMIGSIGNPVIVNKDRDFSIKNVALLKKSEYVFTKWTFYYLSYIQDILKSNASGAVQSFVSLSALRNYLIPLPPLAEQKRIVAKLEEILPLVEEYGKNEEALAEMNEKLSKQIRQSILQHAVQGKLLPQNPNDEPASELLKCIKAEKEQLIKDGKIKKEKPLPPITDEEKPFDLPNGWVWTRLGEIVQMNPRNNMDDNVDVGFVPMNLIKDGFNNLHDFRIKKWGEIKSGFTHFADNDLGIAKITPCFQNRKSVIFKNLPNKSGAGTTELHIIRDITNSLYMPFILLICKTHNFISSGIKNFTGTAGQQRIGKDFICNYLIALPPFEEQKRIVERVNKLMQIIDKIERKGA